MNRSDCGIVIGWMPQLTNKKKKNTNNMGRFQNKYAEQNYNGKSVHPDSIYKNI